MINDSQKHQSSELTNSILARGKAQCFLCILLFILFSSHSKPVISLTLLSLVFLPGRNGQAFRGFSLFFFSLVDFSFLLKLNEDLLMAYLEKGGVEVDFRTFAILNKDALVILILCCSNGYYMKSLLCGCFFFFFFDGRKRDASVVQKKNNIFKVER